MRIPLRAWLEENQLDVDSRTLFDEAFQCFAVSAYRAAFLFSYLGFLRAVAYRILKAHPPNNYPATKWHALQTKVRNDAQWEDAVFQSLQQTRPASLFAVDDDLRTQLLHWRRRRNDAAHGRRTEIVQADVETLWTFIRLHLSKFEVSGGFQSTIDRLSRHLDPRFTPPGRSLEPIVRAMPNAVHPDSYTNLISAVIPFLRTAAEPSGLQAAGALNDFISNALSLNQPHFVDALKEVLLQDEELLLSLLFDHPRLIFAYADKPEFIRRLWHQLLDFGSAVSFFGPADVARSLQLFLSLLQNDLIPPDEREEALERVLDGLADGEVGLFLPDEVLDALARFGFFEAIYRRAFENKNLDWLSDHITLACAYLERNNVTPVIALAIGELYSQRYLGPEEISWLASFFDERPATYEAVVDLARKQNVEVSRLEKALTPYELYLMSGD